MSSRVTETVLYRRAMTVGLTASVCVHIAALAIVTIPGAGPGDADPNPNEFVDESFDAMEIVQLRAPVEPSRTSASPIEAVVSAAAGSPTDVSPTTRSIDEMLADLAPAQLSGAIPDAGRPVVTFSRLEPVQTQAMLAAFAYGSAGGEEDEEGGFGALLGRIGLALSGGGHCPTPGGPLILR